MSKAARRGGTPGMNSLACSPGFRSFVLDQLGELGDVVARSMFGGVGLYHGDVFFGILAGDTLYLKVGPRNLADYQRAGMQPFKPYANRAGTMKYYAVPLAVLESPLELAVWARQAVAAAERDVADRQRRSRNARSSIQTARKKARPQ